MQVAQAQNNFDAERDKPRRVALQKVCVHNRNVTNLMLGELGNVVPIGASEITLYENEVDRIRAGNLETEPEKIKIAQEAYEAAIAEEVLEKLEGFDGDIQALVLLIKSKTDERVNEAHKLVMEETAHSLESTFHLLFKRSIKPLVSFELVGDKLPAPISKAIEEERERMKIFTREALTALTGAKSEQEKDDRIAALERQVGELLKRLEHRK